MSGYQPLDAVIEQVQDVNEQGGNNIKTGISAKNEAAKIRERGFTFIDMRGSGQLPTDAIEFGESIIGISDEERKFLIKKNPKVCVQLFHSILSQYCNNERLQFIVTLLVDITEDPDTTLFLMKTNIKGTRGQDLCPVLLSVLGRYDHYSQAQASLAFARLVACSSDALENDDLNRFLGWTISQLRPSNDYLETICRAVMAFLRKPIYRQPFYESSGAKPVLDLLDRNISFQLQYELIFCLWMLTFNIEVVNKMKEFPIAAVLCDVLRATNRLKVQRVILATFRNLIEKPESDVAERYAAEMIHFKAFPVLNVLVSKSVDDPDFEDDAQFLHDKLKLSLQDLSSFDEYFTEVKSGRLSWSPVHKSEKFWRENVMRLNDKSHELLRLLVAILKESQNHTAIAVAAHDLGEYVRYYPRGKRMIESLGAKTLVMELVNHPNTEIRMQALLSIQKMMVQNWEYLGKQLEGRS